MRLHRVLCPKCHAALTSKAGIPEGQQLNCPKCKARFAAEAPVDTAEVVDDAEVIEDDFEVVEDEPAPKAEKAAGAPDREKKAHRDEDDDAPSSRRRARRDDEEDDRPRKRKNKGRGHKGTYRELKSNVAVRVITLTVLLSILGVLVYLLIEKRKRDRENQTYNEEVKRTLAPEINNENMKKYITEWKPPAPLVMIGVDEKDAPAASAFAKRIIGKWELDGKPSLGAKQTYEFGADGNFTVRTVNEDGGLVSGLRLEHGYWRVKATGNDSGSIQFATGNTGLIDPVDISLEDGGRSIRLKHPYEGPIRLKRLD